MLYELQWQSESSTGYFSLMHLQFHDLIVCFYCICKRNYGSSESVTVLPEFFATDYIVIMHDVIIWYYLFSSAIYY